MTEIDTFIEWVTALISDNLYPGIFLAALLETIFPPIPSEVVFPLAGYVVLKSGMSVIHIFGVGVTGGTGATIGAFFIYLIALKLGRSGLSKYMKFAKISQDKLSKVDKWFEKYGDKSVILGRLVPGLRELVSIPAGIFNMKPKKFLIFTFAGSCAWSILLTGVGYYLGVATIKFF